MNMPTANTLNAEHVLTNLIEGLNCALPGSSIDVIKIGQQLHTLYSLSEK